MTTANLIDNTDYIIAGIHSKNLLTDKDNNNVQKNDRQCDFKITVMSLKQSIKMNPEFGHLF